MKENDTFYNLQADWNYELEWAGVSDEKHRRRLKKLVAFEVDCFRNQSWYRRLLNKMPEVRFFD